MTEADLADWMRTLGPRLLALSRGICGDTAAAEDVVQEAFLKLWRTPPDGPEKVVPTWMRRVVVNLSITHLRRRRRLEPMPEFSYDPALRDDDRPEARIDAREDLKRVTDALAKLPEDKRAILVMRVYEKMSYQEIAEALDVPLGTVMSRLNRARQALKELVGAEAGAEGEDDEQAERTLKFPMRKAVGGT